jgi:hypothetical protein
MLDLSRLSTANQFSTVQEPPGEGEGIIRQAHAPIDMHGLVGGLS